MNSYLTRLKARRTENRAPQALPKLTEAPFVSSVSADEACISRPRAWDRADAEERTAIVVHDGNVPDLYAKPFALLMQTCPAGVPVSRWHLFVDDGGRFLDAWGHQAAALGWTPRDLFGLDSRAPMARYDNQGLIWTLRGETVRLLDASSATLSGGLTYRRRIGE